ERPCWSWRQDIEPDGPEIKRGGPATERAINRRPCVLSVRATPAEPACVNRGKPAYRGCKSQDGCGSTSAADFVFVRASRLAVWQLPLRPTEPPQREGRKESRLGQQRAYRASPPLEISNDHRGFLPTWPVTRSIPANSAIRQDCSSSIIVPRCLRLWICSLMRVSSLSWNTTGTIFTPARLAVSHS